MISFKDGKLIAARNKGHIKNGGKTALDKKGIAAKFKGRGSIRNAFVYAMNELEKAIKTGLSSNVTTVIDIPIDPEEDVLPFVAPGTSLKEMILPS